MPNLPGARVGYHHHHHHRSLNQGAIHSVLSILFKALGFSTQFLSLNRSINQTEGTPFILFLDFVPPSQMVG